MSLDKKKLIHIREICKIFYIIHTCMWAPNCGGHFTVYKPLYGGNETVYISVCGGRFILYI